jgi:hypothetical protein
MKEYAAMASVSEGVLKCACAKEICLTCECREHFHCQDATVTINNKNPEEDEKHSNFKIIK